jgi:hypothetical protein
VNWYLFILKCAYFRKFGIDDERIFPIGPRDLYRNTPPLFHDKSGTPRPKSSTIQSLDSKLTP